jgi:NitT/TauT family transport system substrate-binding protein
MQVKGYFLISYYTYRNMTSKGIIMIRMNKAKIGQIALISALGVLALSIPTQPAVANQPAGTSEVIRIGYFANVTHAPALVAKEQAIFAKAFAKENTKIEWIVFNAGPSAIEAFKGGALDVTYIGPNPSIAGFASTKGSLIRIISGSTANGAQLIVKPSINTVADLAGKKIATPQLGNTQDVALRSWLASKNYKTSITGVGDVTVIPTENAQSLTLFQRGDIDGAWVPEPWASRLVLEAQGEVFLDEKDLWPKKQFLTTQIVAQTSFLNKFPKTIETLLKGHLQAIDLIKKSPAVAKESVQSEINAATGKRLADNVIDRAWTNLQFTYDPLPSSLVKSAEDAVDAGLLTNLGSRGLVGIYDLRILNKLLVASKLKRISAQGLGRQ